VPMGQAHFGFHPGLATRPSQPQPQGPRPRQGRCYHGDASGGPAALAMPAARGGVGRARVCQCGGEPALGLGDGRGSPRYGLRWHRRLGGGAPRRGPRPEVDGAGSHVEEQRGADVELGQAERATVHSRRQLSMVWHPRWLGKTAQQRRCSERGALRLGDSGVEAATRGSPWPGTADDGGPVAWRDSVALHCGGYSGAPGVARPTP
jgi:hypothetical protein